MSEETQYIEQDGFNLIFIESMSLDGSPFNGILPLDMKKRLELLSDYFGGVLIRY